MAIELTISFTRPGTVHGAGVHRKRGAVVLVRFSGAHHARGIDRCEQLRILHGEVEWAVDHARVVVAEILRHAPFFH